MSKLYKAIIHTAATPEEERINRLGTSGRRLSGDCFIAHAKVISGEQDPYHADAGKKHFSHVDLFFLAHIHSAKSLTSSISAGADLLISMLSNLFDGEDALHISSLSCDKDHALIESFERSDDSEDIPERKSSCLRMLQLLIDDIESQMRALSQHIELPAHDGALTLNKAKAFYQKLQELIRKRRLIFEVFGDSRDLIGVNTLNSEQDCIFIINDQFLTSYIKRERIVGNFVANAALANNKKDNSYLSERIDAILKASEWQFEAEFALDEAKMALFKI